MNGLTKNERDMMKRIRLVVDCGHIDEAKDIASKWVRSNKKRRLIRRAATRTVKGLYS